jgi:hypothetical protein
MNISEIEDKLIETIESLGLFRIVDSLGRRAIPVSLNYPSAFVYFAKDEDTGTKPRPVFTLTYEVQVSNKNLKSEKEAAKDTYALLDAIRDAINKKTLGISDIEPFTCTAREITDYADGVIIYTLQFQTRQYLPVVSE